MSSCEQKSYELQKEEKRERLIKDTTELFDHIVAAMQGEATLTNEDYQLLTKMNKITAEKYSRMANTAEDLVNTMQGVQTTYQKLAPYIQKIDTIENGVSELEASVYQLDVYTNKLEQRMSQCAKQLKQ
mmetsp:Transcript_3163/g.4627  ORF Transcript_3163/g.4627 Transcript_3163/m.4627 type:complete len:129 (+) Transcript_3163:103-489(+)